MKAGQEQLQPESIELNEPSSNDYAYRPLTTKHRRAGSTGTTGDEEYTTDEDELYTDETDGAIVASTGLYPQHPFFKSDLTRAATDLFGYASKRDHDNKEPTSLFDEEDNTKFIIDNQRSDTNKSSSLFTFNEKLHNVSSRRQKSLAIANQDKLMNVERAESSINNTQQENIEEVLESQTLDDKTSNKVQQATESEARNNPSSENCYNSASNVEKTIIVPEPETTSFSNGSQETATTESPHPASAVSIRSTTLPWGRTAAEVKEQAVIKLEEELRKAHEELKLKDEEVSRLSRIRQDVETELEELTASLFQEAHNMVREANTRQANAERLLEESRMKAEVLAAEVAALKTLVLTSTPARPNPHLHPQIDTEGQQGLFTKKHRRSPSHFNLKYGRESSPGSPDSPVREQRSAMSMSDKDIYEGEWQRDKEKDKDFKDISLEVDPRLHNEFLRWKANPRVDKTDPFVARIFKEDIDLCLDFPSKELTVKVRQAVLDGIIFIEAASDKTKLSFPKKCALLEAPRQCHYRMRLGDQENQWHCISKICRNRIIAVCDFLNYLRYIERGLVKSSIHDIYWEITRLRKEMVLARLGLALST